jgi:Glycosyl transferase family 2
MSAQGVSIVLRSRNGIQPLLTTLSHIQKQAARVPWEVVLVANADTDNTEIALSSWGDYPIPIRVVHDSKLGLDQGLRETKYEVLGFLDDKSWIAPDWVQTANEAFVRDPTLGAVGSVCEPVFEIPEPEWFRKCHPLYAVLSESDLDQCHEPFAYLSGVGLCVRKSTWSQLIQGGFRSLLDNGLRERPRNSVDAELTLAIRLAGWKIRAERRLQLRRLIPAEHLRWMHLRRLQRGDAASRVLLDAYSSHNLSMRLGLKGRFRQLWWLQVALSLMELARRPKGTITTVISKGENRQDVIDVERIVGRIRGLLRWRNRYGWSCRHVRYAPWRLRRPEEYLRQPREPRVRYS